MRVLPLGLLQQLICVSIAPLFALNRDPSDISTTARSSINPGLELPDDHINIA